MTAAVLAGAGAGLGLVLLAWLLLPAASPLTDHLTRLDRSARTPRPSSTPGPAGAVGMLRRVAGEPLAAALGQRPAGRKLAADLAVLGRDSAAHYTGKAGWAVAGGCLPLLAAGAATAAGVPVPLLLPGWVALLSAGLLFTVPDATVRRRAQQRRADYRAGVGSYLDLVAMTMASGAGLAEALRSAAAVGGPGAFARIRGALEDARTDGLTPAAALGRLGTDLDLPDLVDLAAALTLVDAAGAQAEESLRAKAASLRERELAAAAGDANARSQSMLVAQVLLGLGFLLFIGYPAVAAVLAT